MPSLPREPLLRIHYRDPEQGFEGLLVIDSLQEGCAAGGVRVTRSLSEAEVRRLARETTLKNAALGLAVGGASAGIRYDPSDPGKFEALARFFTHLKPLCESLFSFGPDLNTTGVELDRLAERVGLRSRVWALAASSKAPEAALQRYHASSKLRVGTSSMAESRTAIGVASAVERAAKSLGRLGALKVALQGLGALGAGTADLLSRSGHSLVAVADAGGCYRSQDGFDVERLLASPKRADGTLDPAALPEGVEKGPPEVILREPCDVLVLAGKTDAVTAENCGSVRAKLVVEAGGIAVTEEGTFGLHARGVSVIPDFIAGGGDLAMDVGTTRLDFPHSDAQALGERIASVVGDATERALRRSIRLRLPVRMAVLTDLPGVDLPEAG